MGVDRKARKFVLKAYPDGLPKLSDFALVEEDLPELQDGEILAKATWLTVDPYMRGRMRSLKLGETMMGQQVAEVVESRNPEYPVGMKVLGMFGWRDLTVFQPPEKFNPLVLSKCPDLKGLPDSYALGVIGMPGNTAFFGVTKILELTEGQTLAVSGAAGAVGSIVGQIGKIKGCTVLGFAGSDDKVKWLKDDLGFDFAYNYKSDDAQQVLRTDAAAGIDRYFDNVGGQLSSDIMSNMKQRGRTALCGAIATYHSKVGEAPTVPFPYFSMIYKNLRYEGFIVYDYLDEWYDGLNQLTDWVLEGKIKVQETVTEGFENMSQAFIDLFHGTNTGKQIVKV